jgi:hypothetical protein
MTLEERMKSKYTVTSENVHPPQWSKEIEKNGTLIFTERADFH